MEYLNNIMDALQNIQEENIRWINILDRPDLVKGTLRIASDKVDFTKFPYEARFEVLKYEELAKAEMDNLYQNTSGCRVVFNTDSPRLIIKAHLKRKWGYRKMNLWNSSGFDVYEIANKKYLHKTIVAPYEGRNIFAEQIACKAGNICIYLPTYNCVENLFLGVEDGASFENVSDNEGLPIVFYGHSVTEGAAASRSGNAFPNIVHRLTNHEVINLSCSSCCRGLDSMSDLIGKLNCAAIVIDYTRNAASITALQNTHEKFYRQIRSKHPNKLIIFITSSNFNNWREYFEFDKIVKQTYMAALERNENVKLLDLMGLFRKEEYSLVAVDGSHINDIGMHRIARALAEMLQSI
ncbi:MAG: SGNH/GDSL hydrolase family protein [Lachnospiraceae bacterium]|nr:SGNH/GDSL hydrolase family protein [Lachnospiraceae bacterium]